MASSLEELVSFPSFGLQLAKLRVVLAVRSASTCVRWSLLRGPVAPARLLHLHLDQLRLIHALLVVLLDVSQGQEVLLVSAGLSVAGLAEVQEVQRRRQNWEGCRDAALRQPEQKSRVRSLLWFSSIFKSVLSRCGTDLLVSVTRRSDFEVHIFWRDQLRCRSDLSCRGVASWVDAF